MSDRGVRALVLRETGVAPVLEEIQLLSPREGEVRVAIRAVGVCHSDLSVIDGVLPQPLPCVLGHEASGVIEEIGAGVTAWKAGDRVIVQWVPMCRRCEACKRGEPYLCTTYLAKIGRMDDDTSRFVSDGAEIFHGLNAGAFADQIIVRDTALAYLPDGVPFEVGALIGCGLLTGWGAAVNVARVEPGENVVVIGGGGVGLSAAMGARSAGAASVTVVDPLESRRMQALDIEAATQAAPADGMDSAVRKLLGARPDVVIEAVGKASVQQDAFKLVRPGGRVVFAGANPGETIELPGYGFFLQAKQLLGCWFGACDPLRDVPRVVEAWREGRMPIDRLVTAQRPLEEHAEAFEDLRTGRGLRTVLLPG